MRNYTWNRFPIKNLLIDSLLTPIVESNYLNRDMCKFESSKKDESRWQSTDSSKAYRYTSAFKYLITCECSCILRPNFENFCPNNGQFVSVGDATASPASPCRTLIATPKGKRSQECIIISSPGDNHTSGV